MKGSVERVVICLSSVASSQQWIERCFMLFFHINFELRLDSTACSTALQAFV